MQQEHIETLATTATKVTYGAGAATVAFGLTATEIGLIFGFISLCVTIVSAMVNWHYKRQAHAVRLQLAKEASSMNRKTQDSIFDGDD
jgi:Bacteriophage holin family, superfamily II-like